MHNKEKRGFKKIYLGCGHRKEEGALGLDIRTDSLADVIGDMTGPYLPFRDNTFHEVHCYEVLEHIPNLIAILEEIKRVTVPEGILLITSPYFTNANSFTDPTHCHHFTGKTFFLITHPQSGISWKSQGSFLLVEQKIVFYRSLRNMGIEYIANHFTKFFERYLCYIFPAYYLKVKLQITK